MDNNVHPLPTPKRHAGRRRVNPLPDVLRAIVLLFDRHDTEEEAAEQKLARVDQLTQIAARDLLTQVRSFREIIKIVDPDFQR